MPSTYSILLGALIGGFILWWVDRRIYHRIKRRGNKEEDKKLSQRLKEIEQELFEFEEKKS